MSIEQLAREIEAVVGPQGLVQRPEQVRVYESDGLAAFRQRPALVALPALTEEVQGVVPRGAAPPRAVRAVLAAHSSPLRTR